MRIYVASKFEEKDRTRKIIEVLRNMGHQITHDWTHEIPYEEGDPRGPPYYRKCAEADVAGVQTADAIIVLSHQHGKGMFVEMGIAIARGIPIVAVGPHFNTIFYELPTVTKVQTIEAAYVIVGELAKRSMPVAV
jgi:nucleoside 2-deoxyribosyltransferase